MMPRTPASKRRMGASRAVLCGLVWLLLCQLEAAPSTAMHACHACSHRRHATPTRTLRCRGGRRVIIDVLQHLPGLRGGHHPFAASAPAAASGGRRGAASAGGQLLPGSAGGRGAQPGLQRALCVGGERPGLQKPRRCCPRLRLNLCQAVVKDTGCGAHAGIASAAGVLWCRSCRWRRRRGCQELSAVIAGVGVGVEALRCRCCPPPLLLLLGAAAAATAALELFQVRRHGRCGQHRHKIVLWTGARCSAKHRWPRDAAAAGRLLLLLLE